MAGFREFVTGEVLTAANVNGFLMKQSVMVFADDAARTAALGAEVAEGMLTYNEDTAQLEVYDGSAFVVAAPAPPAGIGSNVVQTVKLNTFSSTSATFVDVTGLTATITPTTATSKILIIAQVAASVSSGNNFNAIFALGGGNAGTYVGNASGVLVRAVTSLHNDSRGSTLDYDRYQSLETIEMVFLDSPATTSAVTYAVQTRVNNGTSFVNQEGADAFVRGASSITAIEVAA